LNEDGQPEHMRIQVVDNVDGASIIEVAQETIQPGATIRTDGLSSYKALNGEGYKQQGEKFDPENNPGHLH
jgi:hypothetical protein